MSGAQNKPQGNADGLLPVGTPDRRVVMYDTTLRDGMQGIQVNYTLDDKIKIAHALDEMRIDYIEGGFPLSNEKEAAFFQQMKKRKPPARAGRGLRLNPQGGRLRRAGRDDQGASGR
jgi:hypothetical protein